MIRKPYPAEILRARTQRNPISPHHTTNVPPNKVRDLRRCIGPDSFETPELLMVSFLLQAMLNSSQRKRKLQAVCAVGHFKFIALPND